MRTSHCGQSAASQRMTGLFEAAYDTIAQFIGAPGRASIAVYRNTTEAINAVMYSLLHAVPRRGQCGHHGDGAQLQLRPLVRDVPEISPRPGGARSAWCWPGLTRSPASWTWITWASLIYARTKLVAVTGASNFLGTRTPLGAIRGLAEASGYAQPDGERRSRLLVDGAQLVPGSFVDVRAAGVDYLAFSFHKMLAPFGIGVLYAKSTCRPHPLPFLYGGDMIAEGRVFPHRVDYSELPWKYAAGTPRFSPRSSPARRCASSWTSR